MRKDLIVISKMNLGFWLRAVTESKLAIRFKICAMLLAVSFLVTEVYV